MDHFGIGRAMKGMAMLYFQSARQSGRTTSLLDSLKDGDRVCFSVPAEAKRFRLLCRERQLDVQCIVLDPARMHHLLDGQKSKGRTLFDHTFVEDRYQLALERCERELDELQALASGAVEPIQVMHRFDVGKNWK